MSTRYMSTPAVRSFAPSRTFGTAHKAIDHARHAAAVYGVAHVVWAVGAGRLRQLSYCPPPRRRA
jgi:hypothetical protein